MHFPIAAALLLLTSTISAAPIAQAPEVPAVVPAGTGPTIKFRTLDNKKRTIIFTADATPGTASAPLPDFIAVPGEEKGVTLPHGWQGNWYAIGEGEQREPAGVLGEIACNGYAGAHYFDVSAEKNQRGHTDGVKQLFPAESLKPMSGCNTFPCNNVYVCPNDELTKASTESVFIQTLGEGNGYDMTDAEYWAFDTRILTTCPVRPVL